MAAVLSGRRGDEFLYEVGIAHVDEDRGTAERLQDDLVRYGLQSVVTVPATPTDHLPESLMQSRVLVVLVTQAALESSKIFLPAGAFLGARGSTALIIPVVFGEEFLSSAEIIRSHQSIVVDPSEFESERFESTTWRSAIETIRYLIASTRDPASTVPSNPGSSIRSPQEALRAARVLVAGQDETGWLLGDELAVLCSSSGSEEVTLSTAFGVTAAIGGGWPPSHAESLRGFVLLRLDSVLDLPQPLPVELPEFGQPIELWNASLGVPSGRGHIGAASPDGSLDLVLTERGAIENGSAVWDSSLNGFLGIAVWRDESRWCLFPVGLLRELAGKSSRSAATAPPSARIHDDSWTIEDRLDYALYGRALREFILHPDTKPPLVIGIQGPWGQGKTSLMRIAQDRLDSQHADLVAKGEEAGRGADGPTEMTFGELRDSLDGDISLEGSKPSRLRTVWFNPWKYQSSESLWAGLAHAILTQLPARLPRAERELFWLRLQLRRIDTTAVRRDIHRLILERLLPWLVVALLFAGMVVAACLAGGVSAALSLLGGLFSAGGIAGGAWFFASRQALGRRLEGSYLRYVSQPDYVGKLGYLHQVEEDVRQALDLLAPANSPTVIFIDDLDRCGAAKISEVLEAINLFLSGEYPNCIFVLGIDAQVVASAMETVYRQALGTDEGEKDDLKGNLGWRFLDKFIQLSFVMPRLSDQQKVAYLDSLLNVPSDATDESKDGVLADAEGIRRDLVEGNLSSEEAAQRVGDLGVALTSTRPEDLRKVAEDVIALGAREFSDADPEASDVLRQRLPFLSDNPRTIKRAVNLYRFYRFIGWARQASAPDLETATPELIACWTVVAARWPQVVHWLQVEARQVDDPEALLQRTWKDDEPELCTFLKDEHDLDLAKARTCGMW